MNSLNRMFFNLPHQSAGRICLGQLIVNGDCQMPSGTDHPTHHNRLKFPFLKLGQFRNKRTVDEFLIHATGVHERHDEHRDHRLQHGGALMRRTVHTRPMPRPRIVDDITPRRCLNDISLRSRYTAILWLPDAPAPCLRFRFPTPPAAPRRVRVSQA